MPTQTIRIRGSNRFRSLLAPAAGAMLVLALGGFALPDPLTLTVLVNQPGPKIDSIFYGLMTEEINYSYDGGLYGELIRNRIFQDRPILQGGRGGTANPAGAQPGAQAAATAPSQTPAPMTPPPSNPAVAKNPNLIDWWLVASNGAAGDIDIDTKDPVNTIALKNSLRLDIKSAGVGRRVGVANDGYWGIPVKPNTTYTASFYARASHGYKGPLTVAIEGNNGTVYASGQVRALADAWQKYTLKIKTGRVQATADARFVLSASNQGSIWFSLVSLFPPTYKNRPNGNRIDIMEKLADMKPSFLRFPGGNYVEGRDFENRFNWKAAIGPLPMLTAEQIPQAPVPPGGRSGGGAAKGGPAGPFDAVYAVASRENATGDVILKLVNVQASPQLLKIDLQGVQAIAKEGKGEVLAAELADMNSVAEPGKVASKPIIITNAGTSFTHELPAHSVTVLRLKTR